LVDLLSHSGLVGDVCLVCTDCFVWAIPLIIIISGSCKPSAYPFNALSFVLCQIVAKAYRVHARFLSIPRDLIPLMDPSMEVL